MPGRNGYWAGANKHATNIKAPSRQPFCGVIRAHNDRSRNVFGCTHADGSAAIRSVSGHPMAQNKAAGQRTEPRCRVRIAGIEKRAATAAAGARRRHYKRQRKSCPRDWGVAGQGAGSQEGRPGRIRRGRPLGPAEQDGRGQVPEMFTVRVLGTAGMVGHQSRNCAVRFRQLRRHPPISLQE